MRTLSFLAFMLLCVLALPIKMTFAGNVLLPSDTTNSNATLPNLGLSAPAPALTPSSTPPTIPQTSPASSLSAPVAPTASPTASSPPTPPPVAPNTDAATAKALLSLSQTPINKIQSLVSPQDAAKLPPGTIPTHIIQQEDLSGLLAQAGAKLPYDLTISLGNQSLFGAKDVQLIGTKLGLSASQVANQCFLTVRGLLQTSTSGYIINSSNPPPLHVGYDGMIKGYMLGALALCTADIHHIPQGSGFLNQINGRFAVPLQPITCPVPTRQVSNLSITYTGTSSSTCSYQ